MLKWDNYAIKIEFVQRIVGALPKNPDVIDSWVKSRIKDDDAKAEARTAQLIEEVDAKEEIDKKWVGFKRDSFGIYLEDRNVNAMLREAANTLELFKGKGGYAKKQTFQHGLFISPFRLYFKRPQSAVPFICWNNLPGNGDSILRTALQASPGMGWIDHQDITKAMKGNALLIKGISQEIERAADGEAVSKDVDQEVKIVLDLPHNTATLYLNDIEQFAWVAKIKGGKTYLYDDVLKQPDNSQDRMIHVTTRLGPRDSLKREDYVEVGTQLHWNIRVLIPTSKEHANLSPSMIEDMVSLGQSIGLGGSRSQCFGQFKLISFEHIL